MSTVTQPTHTLNDRPAIVQASIKGRWLVIFTDTGWPRTVTLSSKEAGSKLHALGVIDRAQQPNLF